MKRPERSEYQSIKDYINDILKYVDHLEAQLTEDWPDASPSHVVVKYDHSNISGYAIVGAKEYTFDLLEVEGNKLLFYEGLYDVERKRRIKHIIDIDLHNIRFEQ